MFIKTKNQNFSVYLSTVGQNMALSLMTIATMLGMVDLPDHLRTPVIVPARPVFAAVNATNLKSNPLRRDKEDTELNYVSYSVAQRTPARSRDFKLDRNKKVWYK